MAHVTNKFCPDQVLVVTAWNSQARNIKASFPTIKDAITWHMLKGERIDGHTNERNAFDVSQKKAIVIDEIMLFEYRKIVKLFHFMESHPEIEFFATGDEAQLEAIDDVVSNEHKMDMLKSSKLFPRAIKLTTNFRIVEEDRQRLKQIQLSQTLDFDVLKKNFKNVLSFDHLIELGIKRGVCFYNSSCLSVNLKIHESIWSQKTKTKRQERYAKTLHNGIQYTERMTLICKVRCESISNSKARLYPNYEYVIESLTEEVFRLRDVLLDSKLLEVSHETIVKCFSLPFANTVHADQGTKIDRPFVIVDSQSDHVTRNWINTAITRATRLDHVHVLTCDLKSINRQNAAQQMVHGYKYQDKKAGRSWSPEIDEFVSPAWILDQWSVKGRSCPSCKECMSFEKSSPNKVTVNRLNNDFAHIVGNIELCCKRCNNSTRNM